MKTLLPRISRDRLGATAIEYGLIAALVALVLVPAVAALGTALKAVFPSISSAI